MKKQQTTKVYIGQAQCGDNLADLQAVLDLSISAEVDNLELPGVTFFKTLLSSLTKSKSTFRLRLNSLKIYLISNGHFKNVEYMVNGTQPKQLCIDRARCLTTDEATTMLAVLAATTEWTVGKLELKSGYISDLKGEGLKSFHTDAGPLEELETEKYVIKLLSIDEARFDTEDIIITTVVAAAQDWMIRRLELPGNGYMKDMKGEGMETLHTGKVCVRTDSAMMMVCEVLANMQSWRVDSMDLHTMTPASGPS